MCVARWSTSGTSTPGDLQVLAGRAGAPHPTGVTYRCRLDRARATIAALSLTETRCASNPSVPKRSTRISHCSSRNGDGMPALINAQWRKAASSSAPNRTKQPRDVPQRRPLLEPVSDPVQMVEHLDEHPRRLDGITVYGAGSCGRHQCGAAMPEVLHRRSQLRRLVEQGRRAHRLRSLEQVAQGKVGHRPCRRVAGALGERHRLQRSGQAIVRFAQRTRTDRNLIQRPHQSDRAGISARGSPRRPSNPGPTANRLQRK